MSECKLRKDSTKIFAELHKFYFDSVDHFNEKWDSSWPKIEEHVPIIAVFYAFQTVGLSYLKDKKEEDFNTFAIFVNSYFGKIFKHKFNEESCKLFFGSMFDMGKETIKIKTDFFENIDKAKEKISKNVSEKASDLIFQFWPEDVRKITNICANYIYYPDITTDNQDIVVSPFKCIKKDFTAFIQFVFGIDIVFGCLTLIQKLFD